MPRQNRYHPYAPRSRQTSQATPQLPSSRYPAAPNLSMPCPQTVSLATVREMERASAKPHQPFHPVQTFQSTFPAYIHGTTTDGQPLVTKSIFQSTDGIFHIQMQAVQYPSEFVGYSPAPAGTAHSSSDAGIENVYDRWVENGPGPTFLNVDSNRPQRSTTPMSQDSGLGSSSTTLSDDGKSVGDEDAIGEDDELYEELLVCYEGYRY